MLIVQVRRPDLTIAGEITTSDDVTVTKRRRDVGWWTCSLTDADDAALLDQPGYGVVIRRDDEVITSGNWSKRRIVLGRPGWTFQGPDDVDLLATTLGFQVPANGSNSSGALTQPDAYNEITDDCETVFKTLVTQNVVTRLGLPVTVATNLARGSTITSTTRMTPLLEEFQRLAELGGLEFSLVQNDAGALVFDAYPAADRTGTAQFSLEAGTLLGGYHDRTRPEVTRAVVAGQNAAELRTFRQRVDAAAETEWDGFIGETFRDARDTDDSAILDQRGDEDIANKRERNGFDLDTVDVVGLRYGSDYAVGDLVRAYVTDAVYVDDVIEEVTITFDRDGETVAPQVGARDDQHSRAAEQLRRLSRSIAHLGRSQ